MYTGGSVFTSEPSTLAPGVASSEKDPALLQRDTTLLEPKLVADAASEASLEYARTILCDEGPMGFPLAGREEAELILDCGLPLPCLNDWMMLPSCGVGLLDGNNCFERAALLLFAGGRVA